MRAAAKSLSCAKRENGRAYFKDALLTPAPFAAKMVISLIGATLRIQTCGGENLIEAAAGRGNVIYAFWHNAMLPMTCILKNKSINVMVSRSRDGEVISKILSRLGTVPIRGSTRKRGAEALVKMIERVKIGEDAAITPDGPQGPPSKAQPGAAYLAAKTSRPVVPAAFASSGKIILKSWDRFIIPVPFSRAAVFYGKPIFVSKKDDLKAKTLEIEKGIEEAVNAAEACLKKSRDENSAAA